MTDLFDPFIQVVRSEIKDPTFTIQCNPAWGSESVYHRIQIREHLGTIDSHYFSREQQIQLYDLNQRPQAAEGFVSISHCQKMGGYSYSKFPHGFDVEEIKRISDPIIVRTTTEQERSQAPHSKLIWVAKEAAYKALSDTQPLIITDLVCTTWNCVSELRVWSYKINSSKSVQSGRNLGFVFSTPTLFAAVFFQ